MLKKVNQVSPVFFVRASTRVGLTWIKTYMLFQVTICHEGFKTSKSNKDLSKSNWKKKTFKIPIKYFLKSQFGANYVEVSTLHYK